MADILIHNVEIKTQNSSSINSTYHVDKQEYSSRTGNLCSKKRSRERASPGEGGGLKRPRKLESIKSTGKPLSQMKKDSNKMFLLDRDEGPLFRELCQHGIAGMSSMAAISSGRHRESRVEFERNPDTRKKLYAQYMQQLEDLLHEFSMHVGLQATVVVYEPSEVNPTNAMKIFGTAPMKEYVSKYTRHIQKSTHRRLTQMHKSVASKCEINFKSVSSILPPVLIHGIPTSVEDLTQAQLRSFLRMLLCEAEGRKTPQWHNPSRVPDWWPGCVPWQNIKTDQRHLEYKRLRCWSDCLRHAVYKCYLYYDQTHLLPEFDMEMYKQVYEHWERDPPPTSPATPLRSRYRYPIRESELRLHVGEVSSLQADVQCVSDNKHECSPASEHEDTQASLLLSAFPNGFVETGSDEDCVEYTGNDPLLFAKLDFDSWLVSDQNIIPSDPVYFDENIISSDFAFTNSDPDSLLCKDLVNYSLGTNYI